MKRTAAIAAFAVSLALLPSCSPEPDNTPTPTPVVTTTTAAPTDTPAPTESPTTEPPEPSPGSTDTLTVDQLAARDVVEEFFRLTNELGKNPDLPLQPLADITIGETQDLYLASLARYRDMNAIQVGDVEFSLLSVGEVHATATERIILVQACTDASDSDMVDRDTGESVLPDDRNPLVSWSINVTAVNDFWLVGAIDTSDLEECGQ